MSIQPQTVSAREPFLVWGASILATAALWGLGRIVPWIDTYLSTFVALIFLFFPVYILWRQRIDLAAYGLRIEPVKKGLLLVLFASLIVLPPFAVGHYTWHSWLSSESIQWDTDRIQRFPQILDDRPEALPSGNTVKTWVDQDSMWVLSTRNDPTTIQVQITPLNREQLLEVVQIGLSKDGVLKEERAATRSFNKDGSFQWSSPEASHQNTLCHQGCGFRFSITDVQTITYQTTPSTAVEQGRWGETTQEPITFERSFWWLPLLFFVQLVAVAIPEEWFFRCYLQQRFESVFAPKWSIFGTPLGWGWIVSAALFALGHLVLDPRVERLAVFFPGLLFGWLFARTRSVAAPALMHAISNVNIHVLNVLIFG